MCLAKLRVGLAASQWRRPGGGGQEACSRRSAPRDGAQVLVRRRAVGMQRGARSSCRWRLRRAELAPRVRRRHRAPPDLRPRSRLQREAAPQAPLRTRLARLILCNKCAAVAELWLSVSRGGVHALMAPQCCRAAALPQAPHAPWAVVARPTRARMHRRVRLDRQSPLTRSARSTPASPGRSSRAGRHEPALD